MSRRMVRWCLAGLWLLDAGLQAQPGMFRPAFVTNVLAPNLLGQPGWLAGPLREVIALTAAHLEWCNTGALLVQLAIGLGLLWSPTVRIALAGSIAWSAVVWMAGEGFGGLFTGTASPLAGAPGAVVLYALLAAVAWPATHTHAVIRRRLLARWGWVALWVGDGGLLLQPGLRRAASVATMLRSGAALLPHWLARAENIGALARAASGAGPALIMVLAVVSVLVGIGVLHASTRAVAVVCGVAVSVTIWATTEGFGGLFTGFGTDPNTGPIVVLLGVAVWRMSREARADVLVPRSEGMLVASSMAGARTVRISDVH